MRPVLLAHHLSAALSDQAQGPGEAASATAELQLATALQGYELYKPLQVRMFALKQMLERPAAAAKAPSAGSDKATSPWRHRKNAFCFGARRGRSDGVPLSAACLACSVVLLHVV